MDVRNTLSKDLIVPRFLGVFSYQLTDRFVFNRGEFAYSVSFVLIFIVQTVVKLQQDTRDLRTNSQLKLAFINTVESILMAVAITLSCIEPIRRYHSLNAAYHHFLKADLLFQQLYVKTYKRGTPSRNLLKWLYFFPMLIIIINEIYRYSIEAVMNIDFINFFFVSLSHLLCNTKLFGIALVFSVFTDSLGDYFTTLNGVVLSDWNHASKRSLLVITETYDCLLDIVYQHLLTLTGHFAMDVRNSLSKDLMVPRFLGVFFYRMTDKFVLNRGELVYSVIFILFFIADSIFKVHMDTRDVSNDSELKLAFINIIESILMTVAITLCCIELHGKSRNLNFVYHLFSKVDILFQRLQVKTYERGSPWRNWLKLAYFWPTYVIFFHDLDRYIREGFRDVTYIHHYLVSFGHLFCNIKLFGIAMTFSVFTDILGDCFTTLNLVVTSDGSLASKRSLFVISETYDCLLDIIHQINSVFASTLLVMVLNCFVKCTDNFYKIIKGDDQLYWCIYFAIWMAVVLMQLLMLVQSVNYPLKQANMYEWLMYKKMKNDPSSSLGPSHTKLTLHLMRRKKAKFDLCGFTTLDNGLLGKISAATLTYSIVLSQLSSYPPPSISTEAEDSPIKNNCSH